MLDNAKGADDNDRCERAFRHYQHNAGHPQHAVYASAEHADYYIPSGYHRASNNGDDRYQPPCRGYGPVQRRHLQLLGYPLG